MRSLRETQQGFAAALLSGVPERGTPGIRADGISPTQRLGFYRTNVFGNYLNALRTTYCAVERLIGSSCFAYYAQRFVRETPSRNGDLNRYGGEFPDFLAGSPIAAELPYLPDVARLECLLDEVFFEADSTGLDLQRLSQVPAEQYAKLSWRLHPACRLLASPYPVRRIWQLSQPDYQDESPVALNDADTLLVRRDGHDPVVEAISLAEFTLLAALRDGVRLEQACGEVHHVPGDFDVGACLQRRIGDGTLTDFALPAEIEQSMSPL